MHPALLVSVLFGRRNIRPIDVDFVVIPTGTVGDNVDTTVLAASDFGSLPSSWAWGLVAGAGAVQHCKIAAGFAENFPSPFRIPAGTLYTNSPKVFQWDLAAGISGGSGSFWAGSRFATASNYLSTDVCFGGLINFTQVGGASAVTYEWMTPEGTDANYAVAQFAKPASGGGNGTFRVEIGNPTLRGKDITVPSTTATYFWCLRYNKTAGKGELCLIDLDTRKIIGVSEQLVTLAALADFQTRDYLLTTNSGGGYQNLGGYGVALGANAIFPLANGITVDAPTAAASSQTAVNEITVTWTSPCARFKVEFSTDVGANWSQATASTLITGATNSYAHAGLTDGLSYIYRLTALVGDSLTSPVSGSSSPTTINNSALHVASDPFTSYANGTDLDSTPNWVQRGTYAFMTYKPAAAAQVYMVGSSSASSAEYFAGTWNANQAAEVEVSNAAAGTVTTWMGPAVRIQSGANTYYRLVFKIFGTDQVALQIVNAGVMTTIGSAAAITMAVGEKLRLDVRGTGAATRLVAQRYTGGAWVSLFGSVATPIDPGTYIDGGNFGIAGDSQFGGDAQNGIMVTSFKGYEPSALP